MVCMGMQVDQAIRLLKRYKVKPVAILARMSCGYSYIEKMDYWDKAKSGGPIVEQATHFVDLMRYICGEIKEETIQAVAIGPNMKLGDLPSHPKAEHMVRIWNAL